MLMHCGVYRSEIFRISGRFLGYYWYCTSQHFELQEIKPNIQLFQYFMTFYFCVLSHRHQQCTALLPEWSKGVDLRPTVSPKRVGSNPTGRKVFVSPIPKKNISLSTFDHRTLSFVKYWHVTNTNFLREDQENIVVNNAERI